MHLHFAQLAIFFLSLLQMNQVPPVIVSDISIFKLKDVPSNYIPYTQIGLNATVDIISLIYVNLECLFFILIQAVQESVFCNFILLIFILHIGVGLFWHDCFMISKRRYNCMYITQLCILRREVVQEHYLAVLLIVPELVPLFLVHIS